MVFSFDDGFEAARELADHGQPPYFMALEDAPIDPPDYEDAACACEGGPPWRLSIDEGEIRLICVKCGRMPEWMENFRDHVSMADILVTVRDTNVPGRNCGCNMMLQYGHDCGPEFVVSVQKPESDMQCPDPTPHGPHCWLLEGRIAAACPGR